MSTDFSHTHRIVVLHARVHFKDVHDGYDSAPADFQLVFTVTASMPVIVVVGYLLQNKQESNKQE